MTDRKARRTRAQMIEEMEAKLAAYKAKEDGTYTSDSETLIGKRLKGGLKRRRTLLHRAQVLIAGRAATEKSPPMNGIDDKIERAEARLEDLIESRERANEQVARLPGDIEAIAKAIEVDEQGLETAEFPSDLLALPGEGEQTNAEAETVHATNDDDEVLNA